MLGWRTVESWKENLEIDYNGLLVRKLGKVFWMDSDIMG